MAGGEKLKGPFSYKVAKKVLSQPDLERLACAFLATENVYQFDHTKAATEFGGSKPDSFKRQIWVITKKIKEAMEKGGDGSDGAEDGETESPSKSKTKAKGKCAAAGGGVGGGRKRKADEEMGDGEGGANGGSARKKVVRNGRGKGKKVGGDGEENGDGGDLLAVKAEGRVEDGEESGEDWLV
ncbi:hypothetical protein Slin15195_G081050 [Septoria linicola]|uniref:Uncharacterized protein n=1 Tax=Septoria linicola TaxID=215465 RepID=A0A9Q9AZX2_9PEZI|nr:hypothetical protein Slin14017_G042260 [Septoria linicola]USW54786.1 hypothetical protein Slin15195_G081050 [Septoria linicola]